MSKTLNIAVTVLPNSTNSKIEILGPKKLKIWLNAKPHDGEANDEVIQQLADFLDVKKYKIQIIQGMKIKLKVCSLILDDDDEYEKVVQKVS